MRGERRDVCPSDPSNRGQHIGQTEEEGREGGGRGMEGEEEGRKAWGGGMEGERGTTLSHIRR